MKTRVSILVPSLNTAKYIGEALDSLINQEFGDFEVLCIDAGSTDGTREIIADFVRRDPRFRLIDSPVRSYGYQMNSGLEQAHGEFVGILEPDDRFRLGMLRRLVQCLDRNDVDFVKGDVVCFSGCGKRHQQKYIQLLPESRLYERCLDPVCVPEIVLSPLMATWSGLYRRTFLERIGFRYRETPGASFQDTGLYIAALAQTQRCLYIHKALYDYRIDNAGASSHRTDGSTLARDEHWEAVKKFVDTLPETRRRVLRPVFRALALRGEFVTLDRLPAEKKAEFKADIIRIYEPEYRQGTFEPRFFPSGRWLQIRKLMDGPESIGVLPRLIQCYRDNGFLFTLKRILMGV